MAIPSQNTKENRKRNTESPYAKVSFEVRVRGDRFGRSRGGTTPSYLISKGRYIR